MTDFVHDYSLATGDDVITIKTYAQGGCSVSSRVVAIGNFTALNEALSAVAVHLRARGDHSEDFIDKAQQLKYWDRYVVDTFEPGSK